jgi:HEAT repeat protein
VLALSATTRAQTPAPETARVEQGRALLAEGNAGAAAALGRTLLAQFPGSLPVLRFAVDAEIAQSGPMAALDTYERWTTVAKFDDPPALHSVARASLKGAAATERSAIRVEILEALVADGDPDAAAALTSEAMTRNDPGLLARSGNEKAVTALIDQLQAPTSSDRKRAILALGSSRSPRAIDPLLAVLNDPVPDVRAAAAEALGKLGASRAIAPLKALLNDPVSTVQFQAAETLFALGDMSGQAMLRQLASNPEPGIRLAAAQAMRSQPDAAWLAVVRDLTTVPDAEIRRQAAELLAPHDPGAAKQALQPLLDDPNVVERQAATDTYLQSAETDLATLRTYLRKGSADSRSHAAMRLLELTR